MSKSAYRWVCKKCAGENDAHLGRCVSCGCPAVVAPNDIDPEPPSREPEHFIKKRSTGLQFFPEALIAGFLILVSPVWAAKLIWQGHALAGIFLLGGVGGAGYVAFRSFRDNEKWMAYASIIGIVVVGAIVNSVT
jgi:hypothetical protein